MKTLSVPDKHRKAIAIRTLRMPDAIANILGGMNKGEARAFLFSIGINPAKYE